MTTEDSTGGSGGAGFVRVENTGDELLMWRQKEHVPKSLSSKSFLIERRIRSWQWRFMHTGSNNLMALGAKQPSQDM